MAKRKNSRTKGKVGELEASKLLKKWGWDSRRGQQFCGANGDPDVVSDFPFHIEVKRTEAFSLYKALEQASDDAKMEERSLVLHRRNQKPWVICMYAEQFMSMYEELLDRQLEEIL